MEDHSFCNMTAEQFDRLMTVLDLTDEDDVTCYGGWLFDDEV